MKNLIIVLAVGLLFTGTTVFADTHGHEVWSADMTEVVSVIPNDVWNAQLAEAYSRNSGDDLPVILRGTVNCPIWYPMNCVDRTGTDAYKNEMKELARQLLANGFWNQFPQYSYWYSLVR